MTLNKIIEMEQNIARQCLDRVHSLKDREDNTINLASAKYHIKIAEYLTELKMIKDKQGRE